MARFAVFGSWRNPADQRGNEGVQKSNHQFSHELSQEEFQRACRELGGELAEQGHQIFVASDSPSTIDFHIVQGVIGVVRKESITQPPILLVRSHARRSSKDANDCSAIHESAARSHPKLFKILSTPEDEVWKVVRDTKDWEVVHDTIAKEADKILVLGGGASTYRIAVRALADGRPIVPIGVFGGAAREVIQMLEKVGDQRNFPKYEYRRVLAHKAWGKEQLQTSLYALGVRQDPNERHKIFINYRRNDSNPIASRIFGDLCRSFSREDVFLDAETIGGGDAFEDRIMTALKQTAVFLLLIGPKWLSEQNAESFERRLSEPNDFVRREIEIALINRPGVRIIPVLVEGASLPKSDVLPQTIRALLDHQASIISRDHQERDYEALVERVKHLIVAPRNE